MGLLPDEQFFTLSQIYDSMREHFPEVETDENILSVRLFDPPWRSSSHSATEIPRGDVQ